MTTYHRRAFPVEAIRVPPIGEAFDEVLIPWLAAHDPRGLVLAEDCVSLPGKPGEWFVAIPHDEVPYRVMPDAIFRRMFRGEDEATLTEVAGPEFRDALMICLVQKLGGEAVLTVAEVDGVGGVKVELELVDVVAGTKAFRVAIKNKQ